MTVPGPTRGRPLPDPGLTWEPGYVPYAARFGDIYYSREGGLAESRHVFVEGSGVREAWHDRGSFCIVELGFGTGLNFLAAWDAWQKTGPAGGRLHYIAVEGYPLTRAELAECLAPWQQVRGLADSLLRAYPEPQPGFHRVFPLSGGNTVVLTLLYGDAGPMLHQLEAAADAWFLDGFAPDRNPDMWNNAVFAEMARLSSPGALVATYSVAGTVRRGLADAGFAVTRAPGYGAKREMLRGRYEGATGRPALQPWFARAAAGPARGHAAIVGGGLAGAWTAAALQARGWTTTLIDRRDTVAGEASGNPMAVVAPRLTAAPALDGRFHAAAWRFALAATDGAFERDAALVRGRGGALQLARDAGEAARQTLIADALVLPRAYLQHLDAGEASDAAGCALDCGGLYFPQAGWIAPRPLCAALTQHTALRLGVEIATLLHADGHWLLKDRAGHLVARADALVLANAWDAARFTEASWLRVQARRGQVTFAAASPQSAHLRAVLLYGGFVTPAHHGVHAVGATFDAMDLATDETVDVRAEDHARNLADLQRTIPDLLPYPAAVLRGFAAVRCTTKDHLPVVGPVPERGGYLNDFASLRHGQPWVRYPDARYQPGLYVLTGLGARGVTTSPLAAELLACHITGEPWPLERDIATALHPGRFLVRELKRREV